MVLRPHHQSGSKISAVSVSHLNCLNDLGLMLAAHSHGKILPLKDTADSEFIPLDPDHIRSGMVAIGGKSGIAKNRQTCAFISRITMRL